MRFYSTLIAIWLTVTFHAETGPDSLIRVFNSDDPALLEQPTDSLRTARFNFSLKAGTGRFLDKERFDLGEDFVRYEEDLAKGSVLGCSFHYLFDSHIHYRIGLGISYTNFKSRARLAEEQLTFFFHGINDTLVYGYYNEDKSVKLLGPSLAIFTARESARIQMSSSITIGHLSYRNRVLDNSPALIKGQNVGYAMNLNLMVRLTKVLYLELSAGYMGGQVLTEKTIIPYYQFMRVPRVEFTEKLSRIDSSFGLSFRL